VRPGTPCRALATRRTISSRPRGASATPLLRPGGSPPASASAGMQGRPPCLHRLRRALLISDWLRRNADLTDIESLSAQKSAVSGSGPIRPILAIQGSDLSQIIGIQRKIEHIEVFADAQRRHRFRNNNITTIEMPPNDNLGWRSAMLLGQCFERWVSRKVPLTERTPWLSSDSADRMVGRQFFLLKPWMQLNLVH
jgi:hypothetical protein